ncbi:NADH-ubiquinone oxidoreductase chain M [hydrothermal vent metagenome]|uniref:NADH-ubiquinone oxidoreductase chain M n=1 Tax=hydrothermal vent metagenome TaxID=652676 RepID=A0A1W1EDW4_9ZZZZ
MKMIKFIFPLVLLLFVVNMFGSDANYVLDLATVGLPGISVALKVTALANFFALLVAISLLLVSFIANKYTLSKTYYFLLYLLSASLLLIVYAHDYLLFFVGWEIMSIATYLLLAYTLTHKALVKYVVFAIASAMALLAAIMILYSANGSFLYADAHASYMALSQTMSFVFVTLMLFAFFVKIGVIGFHFWLVDSYSQSSNFFTPFLAAVVSKMAIYALIILMVDVVNIATVPNKWLAYTLAIMGLLSSIIATFKAIKEDEVKRLLAYSSIAQLGYIVTVLSFADGMSGALYHSLIHTMVKLLLFINIAGIVYVTNKSKFSELGGLLYRMPQSFVLLLIGIITLAGMPPLAGFASKYLIYNTLLENGNLLVLSTMMFSSAAAFLYIYKLIYGIYLGHTTSKKLEFAKEVPVSFLIPQYLLAIVTIVLGAYPGLVMPYINKILTELHLTVLPHTSAAVLVTKNGSYNGFVVIAAFVVIFILVLGLLLRLKNNKVREAQDRFDIAYCGEVPNEGTHLHYGYSMGRELGRVGFISTIWKNSSSVFYDFISKQLFSFADVFRKIYSGNLSVNFNIAAILVLILLWWSMK